MARKVVDLTHPIHEGMTVFPVHWHPKVEVTQLGKHGAENRETCKVVLGTHTGTHCDAPKHFIPKGQSIDEIPIETFVGPATVLDFTNYPLRYELQIEDFEKQLQGKKPERIVMRFDWSDHWLKEDFYVDHPFLAQETAKWLVANGLKLLAMDTPMPDNPQNGQGTKLDSPIHKILLGNGVILIEYLNDLKQITTSEVELITLPLKIRGVDGAPARCAAVFDDE